MPIKIPRFKRLYHVERVAGAGTFLLTETGHQVLNGRLHDLVTPLIDGERTVDDIALGLRDRAAPAEVYYTLDVLEQRGLIEEADSLVPLPEAAFWQALGIDPNLARRRLADHPVAVRGLGQAPVELVVEALGVAGVAVRDDADSALVVADDYRNPDIDPIDEAAVASGQRWGLVKVTGTLAWIGPFFDPKAGRGCWMCLVDRIRMNHSVDTYVEEQRSGSGPPLTSRAALPATVTAAARLAAVEVAKWIARGFESELGTTVVTWNSLTLQLDRHRLVRRPQCPRCGDPEYRTGTIWQREIRPIELVSRQKIRAVEGGHRTATPEETLARYGHQVSPITGAVTYLNRMTPAESPLLHTYLAAHNWATHPDSLAFLKHTLRSQSGGKGKTDAQARASALAEAFERYSGVYRGDEIRRWGTRREIGEAAIHPNDCMLFSEAQYRDHIAINQRGNSFQMVPHLFDESQPTHWSPLWSLTRREPRYLPTGYLYYGYSKAVASDTPNRLSCYADSNGCAGGNTLEEAILQGLLEIVERDAVATWWYNRVRRPAVRLEDLDDPFLTELTAYFAGINRDLWVLDITNDIGIPAFAAFSRRLDLGDKEEIVVGFGAHLDPQVGIIRAITEANQFLVSLSLLGNHDVARAFDPGAVEWWETATRQNQPYIVPAGDLMPRRLAEFPRLTSDDLRDELLLAIDLVEQHGREVLVLDQTRPDVEFPVAKVVVPGMRHFWARLAPGRLYEVPVKLGWLPAPLPETTLNPVPVFF